ncbi:beta-aspartyl-peptidase [Acetivibrio straminisolvens]|jgi:beta-aspartyl-dipeptidase (metallo-type)|uniref:Isoaspartyl dipeptidase n=1 Tax=Acetivibrio straminisolvens JCM 21531 TaxID=1294263 RepID=W4V3Q3_9FIRM|nr:beta-aspartyl-peptidase [Acetivibrio straminisolvens]GAE87831.1 isoaspartyl dipeptidase [Acetivibrio straminisolvens JCM 21531]
MEKKIFKLLKSGICYAPEFVGKKDILVVQNKIYKVENHIDELPVPDLQIIDCSERIVCPGFIDQHIHIIGGGGEEGPVSRIPEIMLSECLKAGITTAVGVLGADSITRSISNLLAKARALEEEGLNTYIYTGSYRIPTDTLTANVMSDIALVDKIIGVGEIAVSDHRSSHPSLDMLKAIASEARIGGLIGKKAGVVHIHVGDGKKGLDPVIELIENCDFPIEMFVPTHLNRNKTLFSQATEYAKRGGNIDLTAGETNERGYTVPDALKLLSDAGVNMDRVTVSSDANGSIPKNDRNGLGVGSTEQLINDIRNSILINKLSMEQVLKTVTVNVAKVLKLYPKKGVIRPGSDADILVLQKEDLKLDKVFVNGEQFADNGTVFKKGRYERK